MIIEKKIFKIVLIGNPSKVTITSITQYLENINTEREIFDSYGNRICIFLQDLQLIIGNRSYNFLRIFGAISYFSNIKPFRLIGEKMNKLTIKRIIIFVIGVFLSVFGLYLGLFVLEGFIAYLCWLLFIVGVALSWAVVYGIYQEYKAKKKEF